MSFFAKLCGGVDENGVPLVQAEPPPPRDSLAGMQLLAEKGLRSSVQFTRRSSVRSLHSLISSDDLLCSVAVHAGCVPPLLAIASDDSSQPMQREALRVLALLGLNFAGIACISTDVFVLQLLKLCLPARAGRAAPLGYEASLVLCALSDDGATCARLLAAGCAGSGLVSAASPNLHTAHLGFHLLSRFAEVPGAAVALVNTHGARRLASLVLLAQQRANDAEHLDAQKGALKLASLLASVREFADALEAAGGLDTLLREVNAEVPALRTHAGSALAALCHHPRQRLLLVRKKILQTFISMASVRSRRADLRDCKRVAALGICNCAATYHLRLACAAAGALPAVQALLRDEDAEVRCLAANATMMLALHEDSGRRLVFTGALRPLMAMVRSGDHVQERCGVGALATLAINDENQRSMVLEGILPVISFLVSSADESVIGQANKLLRRLRLGRMRHASRMAQALAAKKIALDALEGSGGAAAARAPTAIKDVMTRLQRTTSLSGHLHLEREAEELRLVAPAVAGGAIAYRDKPGGGARLAARLS